MDTFTIILAAIIFIILVVAIMVGYALMKKIDDTDPGDLLGDVTGEGKKLAKEFNQKTGLEGPDNYKNEGEKETGCKIWPEISAGYNNANMECKNLYGDEYSWVRSNQGPCFIGFGVGICAKDPAGPSAHWRNCIGDGHHVWNDAGLRDQWCRDDLGPNARYIGKERAGCALGWSRGLCRK